MIELSSSVKSMKWMFGAVLLVAGALLYRTFSIGDQMAAVQVKTERSITVTENVKEQNDTVLSNIKGIESRLQSIELINERLAARLEAIPIKSEERQ